MINLWPAWCRELSCWPHNCPQQPAGRPCASEVGTFTFEIHQHPTMMWALEISNLIFETSQLFPAGPSVATLHVLRGKWRSLSFANDRLLKIKNRPVYSRTLQWCGLQRCRRWPPHKGLEDSKRTPSRRGWQHSSKAIQLLPSSLLRCLPPQSGQIWESESIVILFFKSLV